MTPAVTNPRSLIQSCAEPELECEQVASDSCGPTLAHEDGTARQRFAVHPVQHAGVAKVSRVPHHHDRWVAEHVNRQSVRVKPSVDILGECVHVLATLATVSRRANTHSSNQQHTCTAKNPLLGWLSVVMGTLCLRPRCWSTHILPSLVNKRPSIALPDSVVFVQCRGPGLEGKCCSPLEVQRHAHRPAA